MKYPRLLYANNDNKQKYLKQYKFHELHAMMYIELTDFINCLS